MWVSSPQPTACNVKLLLFCCCVIHTYCCQSRCCWTAKWGWKLLLVPFVPLPHHPPPLCGICQWNLHSKMNWFILECCLLMKSDFQSFPLYKIDIVDISENLLCFAGFSATLIYAIKIWLFLKLHYFNASTRQLKSLSPCHISSDWKWTLLCII